MQKYFNVNIEFEKQTVDQIIEDTIACGEKGYVCVVESNNLTVANRNIVFGNIVNDALVNVCDGSMLALILGKIHHQKLKSYTGADLFFKYIHKKKYRQYFLGNTATILNGLKANMSKIDPEINDMVFSELPFMKVEDFDYPSIAENINKDNPDIIWVSLGAPKQEFFMASLLPFLNRGVMFGVGAVFNFYSGTGKVKRAPLWMRKMKLEWLYRALEEPKKNIPRYWNFIKILPSLIVREKRLVSP
ncbi:MAG: WecB/TagA/CpsF family glycosyltransferase [Dysgonamonadaceae bacterium]|jgi:N-acetylglucosaminyldiphosphoundecaprenol N-acetyl-beta-D-mannosaminyltransferase|nr:WecB/TagA/CpsF family glycosyltransferase [Dysgonamonadaceae bacterium]